MSDDPTSQRWQALGPAEITIIDTKDARRYALPAFLKWISERELLAAGSYSRSELHMLLAANGIAHESRDLDTALTAREIDTLLASHAPAPVVRAALRQGRVSGLAEGWGDALPENFRPGTERVYALDHTRNIELFRAAVETNFLQEEVFVMGTTETGVPLTEVVRTHVGRHDQATLYGMELLRPVVFCPAMVMCHSHPNGDATPSPADKEFTANVATGFARLGLRLLEHYIIAGNGGYARLLADHMPELAAAVNRMLGQE